MCFLMDGVEQTQSARVEASGSCKNSYIHVNLRDSPGCTCLSVLRPHPRIPAYFCIFLLTTQAMTSMFCSTKTVIAKVHSEFSSVVFDFAFPGVNHQFHYSDIYGCVSSGKPCAVVTGSWQVQEKCKWSFIGIVLFFKIPFRKWSKKYWLNWTDWHVGAC